MIEVAPAGEERDADLQRQHQRAAGPGIAQPQPAGGVLAVSGGPQVQRQSLDRRQRARLAEVGPLPVLLAALEDHGTHVRKRAHATRTGLGHHQQAVGRNEIDPAARTLPAEVLRAEVVVQVVPAQRAGAEEQGVRRRGGAAAVVPGAGELPGFLAPGHRMDARLLLAGPQVVGPRFGVQRVADHHRTHAVADLVCPTTARRPCRTRRRPAAMQTVRRGTASSSGRRGTRRTGPARRGGRWRPASTNWLRRWRP